MGGKKSSKQSGTRTKQPTVRKTSDKDLVRWLFGELTCIFGHLDKLDDERDFMGNDPDMDRIVSHLSILLEFLDKRYNLFAKAEDFDSLPEVDEFCEQEYSLFMGECHDCESEDFQYYSVKNELWEQYGFGLGLLCLPCFEKRLGRKLTKDDFIDCPLNDENDTIRALRGLPPLEEKIKEVPPVKPNL